MARAAWEPDGKVMARVRKICAGLEGAEEKTAWGHPVWRAGGRQFAAYERNQGQDCLAFLVELEMLGALLEAGPRFRDAGFSRGDSGWVFLQLSPDTDWAEVRDLFRRSHAFACSKKPARPRPRRLLT
ncbi:MAG TPA: MmcQ/YjbR family DNA-binding protein [Myxococcales bacterium]|nr:MmcQ/YjbR family DNA-binding protein [Myxococcales bacterium]